MTHRFLREVNLSSASTTSPPKPAVAEPPEPMIRESDLVVILAALLCAAISVAGLIAVVRCAWMRHGASGGRRPSASPNKGLKKKVVQSLPKFIYDMEAGNEKMCGSTECAVCLSEYVDGDEIRLLPQCGHGFHVACIDTWLASHSSCPSCRQVLVVTNCRKCGDRR